MSAPYEFEMDLRWSDQDLQGHVNNAKVVTLAEEARVRFQSFLDRATSGPPGSNRVVARQEIDYHAQTRYAPRLTMQVGVRRIGTKSFTLRHRGIQDGVPVFTVDAIMVNVDETGRSRALTEEERAQLDEWSWPD
ncbi:thioesterase family protein [Citricoccus sp.]|uniref:acyl-CoA thioesterase n=1 Tax=Citricoccus sp. TaxID=1978372 RepID=UPI0028BDF364|nr:thioesterase family protein [Citricoccus sp.]